jgi:molecular chaperone GrpE
MNESKRDSTDSDGVVIKKKNDEQGKIGSVGDQEIPIDSLDRGESASPGKNGESKESRDVTEKSRVKSQKEHLLKSLSEKEIAALLTLKKELEEKNINLQEKDDLIKEYEDLLKRKQAEFENYRKRILKEGEENKRYATAELVLDIITIMDNFDRAVDAAKSTNDFDGLIKGIIMIEKQFRDLLEKKYGVKKIESVGKEFDPTYHDAIMVEESEKYEEDTVVEDFLKGYIMHDRIIRPSKVKVAKSVSSINQINNNSDIEEGENPEED